MVLNDTRVSALRLFGQKATGGQVETLLLREDSEGLFDCLLRPGKRLPAGTSIQFGQGLRAEVVSNGEVAKIQFETNSGWRECLETAGLAPLPPYIRTPLTDRERYQTVVAAHPGSAAAPTAGLHFTREFLGQLQSKGVGIATVTLHVGLDTFRPIQTDSPETHVMHGEECEITASTAEKIAKCRGRVVAVGTTTTRTLETFATGTRHVEPGRKTSRLFIQPGYEFQIVEGMFTNFHMPRTTMLLMVAALASRESVERAYAEAVKLRYRFLSFGDSMLIL